MSSQQDDARDAFYVGYLDPAPPALGRWLKGRVAMLLVMLALLALASAALQSEFARSRFEYGKARQFTGRIELEPVPTLVVARPNGFGTSRYLLVAPFKHGADDLVGGLAGQVVQLEGSLIHRDDMTLIELVPDSIEVTEFIEEFIVTEEAVDRGEVTLEGEIVDSKCFFGVMKPGNLKPHRACASLCIRGGIPPVLCVRDENGLATYWVLVGTTGEPVNMDVLPFVAEPVRLTGRASSYGDMRVLHIDPTAIERL